MSTNSHLGYHRLGSANSIKQTSFASSSAKQTRLNNPRYRILQSSLATLLQLKNQEENAFKIAIYENSIALIQKEIKYLALTDRFGQSTGGCSASSSLRSSFRPALQLRSVDNPQRL